MEKINSFFDKDSDGIPDAIDALYNPSEELRRDDELKCHEELTCENEKRTNINRTNTMTR